MVVGGGGGVLIESLFLMPLWSGVLIESLFLMPLWSGVLIESLFLIPSWWKGGPNTGMLVLSLL